VDILNAHAHLSEAAAKSSKPPIGNAWMEAKSGTRLRRDDAGARVHSASADPKEATLP